jgi:putative intracellular protease/amidase
LIYGLSSAFLLIGSIKYYDAAKAGVAYLRKHFRIPLTGGHEIIWAHGKTHASLIIESQNDEDLGSIPLYEQIYVLAGLTQYYRISNDEDVLEDIIQTVRAFQRYWKDPDTKRGGWFSHLDYATFTYDSPHLDNRQNSARKNWNSIGDHIPAYLVNVLLALNPLPSHLDNPEIIAFVKIAKDILKESTHLIVEKFPEKDYDYVQERFYADWTPDRTHTWQQNRAIVGHNLKIAWNLTRVANYYLLHPEEGVDVRPMLAVAEKLGKTMIEVGAVDLFRGGAYDCVERQKPPANGFAQQFTWRNTKDFWQQEQGILAYYILYGYTHDQAYLDSARDMTAFWNVFFLDHTEKGVFFRTTDDGLPYVKDGYGDKAGHAIAGYHAFELSFLAHIYTASYVSSSEFTIYYRPDKIGKTEFNVLPDNIKPGTVDVIRVTVNGLTVPLPATAHPYTIHLKDIPENATFAVTFASKKFAVPIPAPKPATKGRIGVIVESHFDETEVRKFNEFFPKNGYEVDYITYLWGADKVTYAGNDHADQLVVRKDFSKVNIADYKGFILIGGYATDRLRYEGPPRPIKGEKNHSPAVEFVRKILQVPGLKVGTICHSLWLLTVDPTLLQGRKVVCAPNIIYDVINAGADVQYNDNGQGPKHVVVDRDFISAAHPDYVNEFVDQFLIELNGQAKHPQGVKH